MYEYPIVCLQTSTHCSEKDLVETNLYDEGASPSIVVDLDGTLTPTDTLIESIVQIIKKSPLNLLYLAFWLTKSKAAFKKTVALQANITAEHLPYFQPLQTYLRREKQKGRHIVLATAAHQTIAQAISTYLDLFDDVLATDGRHNLKGKSKLEAIQEKIGENFIYAGNSWDDLPIWKAAKGAILVGVSPSLAESVRRVVPIVQEFQKENHCVKNWLHALRVHQWLKNLLLFVPLLTSFSFMEGRKLLMIVVAFLAFSFTASATYIVNDLCDLENDRTHPRKRLRPFASAKIPILQGIIVAGCMLVLGCFLALTVSENFFLMLLLYLALTSAYSWVLKQYALIDVLVLSLLYIMRILAGSAAVEISTSSWLLVFSAFMFLSLALVKRCSELVAFHQIGKEVLQGRDYRFTDLVVLWPLGLGSALSALVVFGLFIDAPETQACYATPHLLWFAAIGFIYWLARVWIKTSRGEMHDDPVTYAIKDPGSRITIFAIIIMSLVARYFAYSLFS
ncbi:MAG: UbiA family prenyltransferase [Clostridia bacterium]|nr:UbiA family prenyltransferase [Clostridia bacterium]